MKLKYVIFNGLFPVIFGEATKHSDLHVKYNRPTSAGFVSLQEVDAPTGFCQSRILKAHCYGESISLNLKPAAGDEQLIEKMLNS